MINNNLIGHNNFFNKLVYQYDNNILPNKILLSGKKGIGKSLLVDHFINYVFSNNEEYKYNLNKFEISSKNKSYILLKNASHPNVFKISKEESKKHIDISQIREMIHFQNNSTFNNKIKCIIIDDLEYLNISSTNALLKSLEEPNDGVFFFLIFNSHARIMDTLKSRCLEFKLSINNICVKNIVDNYFQCEIFNSIPRDFVNYYSSPSFLIDLIKFFNNNSINLESMKIENLILEIIKNKHYSKNIFIYENINTFIELFFYKNINITKNISYKIKDFYYLKLNNIKKYNLDLESFFIEFKENLISE